VTGASRGIGLAVSEVLHSEGACVVRLARSLVTETTDRRVDIKCDVTSEEAVSQAVSRVLAEVGAPQIVVNNAGAFVLKPLAETTAADFRKQLAVNLTGSFLLLRELVPHLIRLEHAHIVTIGSVADHVPFPGNAAYASSKYGLRGMHEVLSRELTGTDVRMTLISPGPTNTSLWDELDADAQKNLTDRTDMLCADDVAQAVLFAVTRPARVNVELMHIMPMA
jgi:NADP-dependent 3-hydroxy acid dehydrogenase YdfG